VILAFRRGSESERLLWKKCIQEGAIADGDLEQAIELLRKHRALEDTVERARHYGAIAKDALAIFPASDGKQALLDVVDFCVSRAH
jgi:octaprenyl-diphosphate synthase